MPSMGLPFSLVMVTEVSTPSPAVTWTGVFGSTSFAPDAGVMEMAGGAGSADPGFFDSDAEQPATTSAATRTTIPATLDRKRRLDMISPVFAVRFPLRTLDLLSRSAVYRPARVCFAR